MKKKDIQRLTAVTGVSCSDRKLRLQVAGVEQIGRNYEALEQRAYGSGNSNSAGSVMADVAQHQNDMLAKLQPMVAEILRDPKDPRYAGLQAAMKMFGGLPGMNDVEQIRRDVQMSGGLTPPPEREPGIELEFQEGVEPSLESLEWLATNFSTLLPGVVEAARYAYSRLAEESLTEDEESVYLLKNPADQDYLDRVQVDSITVHPGRRYDFSFNTPCGHLIEHGMYALFEESRLIVCGEHDVIAEFEDSLAEQEDE